MDKSSTYTAEARKRWPKVVWIDGDGRYATVSGCSGSISVYLHPTIEEADFAKENIDELGCCCGCTRDHRIVDLSSNPD